MQYLVSPTTLLKDLNLCSTGIGLGSGTKGSTTLLISALESSRGTARECCYLSYCITKEKAREKDLASYSIYCLAFFRAPHAQAIEQEHRDKGLKFKSSSQRIFNSVK